MCTYICVYIDIYVSQDIRLYLAPSSRVARDGPRIFTPDQKLRRVEIIRSQ